MNNITSIAAHHAAGRPTVHQLDPHNLAIQRMFRNGHYLDRVSVIEKLTRYLMDELKLSERSAEIAAIQAFAETSRVNQVARIDIDASTSHVVVLRTVGGRSVVFTADDLLRVLERARDEGRARVVNGTEH